MIANRYNQLLNNFKKIKLTANNHKKSLENIANLKKEFLKIKDFRKSSSNNKDKLFNGINIKINYQVIENELNNLRDIFLKDNLLIISIASPNANFLEVDVILTMAFSPVIA